MKHTQSSVDKGAGVFRATIPFSEKVQQAPVARTETRVLIRVASPMDAEGLRAMLSRASSETIYRRFHIPYPEVPEWMLSLMLGAVRHDTKVLVAVARGEIIGHAMYVGLGSGDEAEMAIIVEDGWQSKGVGKLLLSELAESARLRGYGTFVGEVLGTNRPMLGLAAMFPDASYTAEDGVSHVRMTLGATSQMPSTARTGHHAA